MVWPKAEEIVISETGFDILMFLRGFVSKTKFEGVVYFDESEKTVLEIAKHFLKVKIRGNVEEVVEYIPEAKYQEMERMMLNLFRQGLVEVKVEGEEKWRISPGISPEEVKKLIDKSYPIKWRISPDGVRVLRDGIYTIKEG